jgi:hypothetical protein
VASAPRVLWVHSTPSDVASYARQRAFFGAVRVGGATRLPRFAVTLSVSNHGTAEGCAVLCASL